MAEKKVEKMVEQLVSLLVGWSVALMAEKLVVSMGDLMVAMRVG